MNSNELKHLSNYVKKSTEN